MKYILKVDPRVTLIEPEKTCSFPVFVRFSGEFSEENCMKFRQELIQAENAAVESQQKVLPIVIDSYGGDVYALMACIDAINAVTPEITIATIVEGKAMSCGAILLSCGKEGYRFAGPNSTVMIHEVSSFSHGKIEEIKANAKESDRLNVKVLELMADNCNRPKDYFVNEITKRKHADWFLDANDCLTHNITNYIGTPKFNVSVDVSLEFDTSSLISKITSKSDPVSVRNENKQKLPVNKAKPKNKRK